MRAVRYVLVALAALFLLGAVISFVVLFDDVETTTAVLAGGSMGCSFAAYGLLLKERGKP